MNSIGVLVARDGAPIVGSGRHPLLNSKLFLTSRRLLLREAISSRRSSRDCLNSSLASAGPWRGGLRAKSCGC